MALMDDVAVSQIMGPSQRPPARWKETQPSLHAQTYTPGNPVLMTWGPLQFTVFPLNFHELDHETATDWSPKEISGAPVYREWVGEKDELVHLRGKLFPYRIGGLGDKRQEDKNRNIGLFNAYRLAGAAHMLIRGDGTVLGWYVCEKLHRSHTFLSSEGVGKQIAFEAVMARVPMPASDAYWTDTWQAGSFAGPGG